MSTTCAARRRFVTSSFCLVASAALAGCGTLLHPERRGQGSGKLDWRIVGLDAAGLLLFFVPGLVAFAVDFYQGTIFLPAGSAGVGPDHTSLFAVRIPQEELTPGRIEQTVSEHIDHPVRLEAGSFRSSVLQHLDHFWVSRDRLMQSSEKA